MVRRYIRVSLMHISVPKRSTATHFAYLSSLFCHGFIEGPAGGRDCDVELPGMRS